MMNCYLRCWFSVQQCLHPLLADNLRRRGIFPLKTFQEQAFNTIQNGNNIFINSCTGSGKTLAYLIPIVNALYHEGSSRESGPRGALILTLNKELVGQVYQEAKLLDSKNLLRVHRTGSLNQSREMPSKEATEQQMQTGFVNTVVWSKIDMIISTPQAFANYLKVYKKQKTNEINPQFLVVDEADLLLELDKNVSKNTDKIIKHVRQNSTASSNIKYLLTTSSFPKKYKGEEAIEKLQENFKTLTCIEGIDKHKLPQNLELYYIEMQQKEEERLLSEKTYFIRRILSDRKSERIIIFCKQKAHILMLSALISEELALQHSVLYAELKTQERATALAQFSSGKTRLLICSELGGRGLDFALPVDCIVEFDMAENIVHFINRAGRTARNGLKGQVITFVEARNQQFFEHLKTLKSEDQEFNELFSRKRSYSKLYKAEGE